MKRPRVVIYCGRTLEDLAPPVINTEGRGGSETAVVEIARRFARDGWRVDVYAGAGHYEGEYDDVGYWEPNRLTPGEQADVLVSWRHPEAINLPVEARKRVLWLHDLNYGPGVTPDLPGWDRVLGVSQYHANYLAEVYGITNVDYVPNGINLSRFDPSIRKVSGRCVFASSPDRGLMLLLKLWPRIIGDEKQPELHVCYGWQNVDRHIEAGRRDLADFRDKCMAMIERTPQVVYRGRLPQDELAELYCQSYASLYPGDFLETSYIGAMEAMAGGCVPITSSCGATKDTVGDGGLVVWGPGRTRSNPYSPSWQDFYVQCARGVLFELNTRRRLEGRARERAKLFTWDNSFARWKSIVTELLEGDSTPDGSQSDGSSNRTPRIPVLAAPGSHHRQRTAVV